MSRRLALAAIALALAAVAAPRPALAAVWREGVGTSPFTLSSAGGLLDVLDSSGDHAITLPYEASTLYDGSAEALEPRSLRVAADGSFLVATGAQATIDKISPTGQRTQQYTMDQIPGLLNPFDALPLGDGGMLVVDRSEKADISATSTAWVKRLDRLGTATWELHADTPPWSGEVFDPFTAEPVDANHTLIADSRGCRVVEVDNTTGAIQWHFGTFKQPGSGSTGLNKPHSAQWLPDTKHILICDQDNNRVIEVTNSTPAAIVWSYGSGVAGAGPDQLSGPNAAVRLPGGDTLISDKNNNRVIVVDQQRNVVEAYGVAGRTPAGGTLSSPEAAVRAKDGSTVIADFYHHRLVRYGYHPHREYVATSGPIDPAVGKIKWFSRITVRASCPPGATVISQYSTDGTNWFDIPSTGILPTDTHGSAIRYRMRLTAAAPDAAPVVKDVSITWSDTAPSAGTGKSASGSGSASGHTSSSSGSATSGAQHGTTLGARNVTPSGTGSQQITTLAPGGSGSAIGEGSPGGGTGPGSAAVRQATTMSGWVMSEVKDDVGGAAGSSGTGALGASNSLGRSTAPGVALLLATYTVGLAWSPASRFMVRAITAAMPH